MAKYLEQANVFDVFGTSNCKSWADLEGSGDETEISDRLNRAIDYAEAYVEDRFRSSAYQVPFVQNSPTSLDSLKYQMSRIAGVWLYTSRGLNDGSETVDKMLYHQEQADEIISQYLGAQMVLDAKRVSLSQGSPAVVTGRIARDSMSRLPR